MSHRIWHVIMPAKTPNSKVVDNVGFNWGLGVFHKGKNSVKQQYNEEQRQRVTAHHEQLLPVTVKSNRVLKLETTEESLLLHLSKIRVSFF